MSLRFWRRKDATPSEATHARIKAERDLARTRAETPIYREWAETFIEAQRVNHLGLNAAKLLRRGK